MSVSSYVDFLLALIAIMPETVINLDRAFSISIIYRQLELWNPTDWPPKDLKLRYHQVIL